MWQRASLKQRLLALVLSAIALVWLGMAAFIYLDAREEFDEVLDGHLAQTGLRASEVRIGLERTAEQRLRLADAFHRRALPQLRQARQVEVVGTRIVRGRGLQLLRQLG